MERESRQHPRDPVKADSFIYDPEAATPEPPDHITAIPEWETHGLYAQLLKIEKPAGLLMHYSLVFMGLALAALMFAQVLMRYVFKSPFVGIEEIGLLFGAWFYFLGMAYVTRNGEHIHGGIVSLIISNQNGIRVIRLLSTLICILATVVFGFFAIKYAWFEIEKGRLSSYMRWPKGLWSASMIFGFLGMAGYFMLQAVNQVVDLRCHLGRSGGKS